MFSSAVAVVSVVGPGKPIVLVGPGNLGDTVSVTSSLFVSVYPVVFSSAVAVVSVVGPGKPIVLVDPGNLGFGDVFLR